MFARARQLVRLARRVGAHAVLMLAAVAVLAAVVRGGTRFFYCPFAGLAFDEVPCATPADDGVADRAHRADLEDEAPAVRAADCCEEKWRPAAPTATTPNAARASVEDAALVAITPPPRFEIGAASAKLPFALPLAVRAGPPPAPAGERRARLMVFHI